MKKLVSIIIPTYKRPFKIVKRAIDSVKNQSYQNIEIIVVDDSPIDYPEIEKIKDYVNKNKNMIYIKNRTNLGGGKSRNKGIENANGVFVTFLDDDDVYLPLKIENQVNFMEKNEYDMSFTKMNIYNTNDKLVDVREYKNIPISNNSELLKYHLKYHMTGTPTFMYRIDSLKKIGGFDDVKMGQEFYLMLKTIKNDLKVGYMDKCDIKVYKHEGEAISKGTNKINGENNLFEMKKQYFDILDRKEIKFITFRHYIVLSVANLRNKHIIKSFGYLFLGFLYSPGNFALEGFNFIKKRK
ncbi:glycosyltransferase family 2 protein [Vagococcus sp.]|uniref:glycosyltransferase family 2 protein n=1 Tax=Vagococcus sp. TaxID=1933889 RepID=UPI002FCC7104